MYKEFLSIPLSAKLGLIVIAVYLFVALFAPVIAPYSETEILGGAYEVWSKKYQVGLHTPCTCFAGWWISGQASP